MGENHFTSATLAVYSLNLLLSGMAFTILQMTIVRQQGEGSLVAAAVGSDQKGKLSLVAYLVAIPVAFVSAWISGALCIGVALMWLVPDQRIERVLGEHDATSR